MSKLIAVEVAYALPTKQHIVTLQVAVGSTIEAVIQQSGILMMFPEIDLTKQSVGVFSKPRLLSDEVLAGDRVEIYRPLTMDPKAARRKRAALNRRTR